VIGETLSEKDERKPPITTKLNRTRSRQGKKEVLNSGPLKGKSLPYFTILVEEDPTDGKKLKKKGRVFCE